MPQHRALLLLDIRPDIRKGRRTPTVGEVIAAAREVKADGVDLSSDPLLERPFVEKLRQAGLEVYVWTVDSPEDARRLIGFGVAGIATNRAGWMKEQLAKGKASFAPPLGQ